ncbi:MAG: cupredoxin domain-containing protein [Salinigranum sp.]
MTGDRNSESGDVNRRRYLKLAGGATLAVSTTAGCIGKIATSGKNDSSGGSSSGGSSSGGSSSGDSAKWKKDLGTDFQFWMVTNEVMKRKSFFPATYFVTEGSKVGIHLKNTGDEKHDFSIDAFDIGADHEPGTESNITFTADKVGIHKMYCDLHPPWMSGQMVVLPKDAGKIPAADSRDLWIVANELDGRKSFFPGLNVVTEGENVTIHFKNTGDEKHDFSIDAFDIGNDHEAGTTSTMNFTADKVGIHKIYCDLHPPWMSGQLLVLPKDGDWSRIKASDKGSRDLWINLTGVGHRDSMFPGTWAAKAGENVTAHLWNNDPDGAKHDFSIDAFDVSGDHKKGTKDTASFTADTSGIIRMFCDIHTPEMNGQLLVVPKEKGGIEAHGYD